MATRRKIRSSNSSPSAEIRGRFPAGHLLSPLGHHLPARAWARLFAIAVDRLHRAGKPGWAELRTKKNMSKRELAASAGIIESCLSNGKGHRVQGSSEA